MWHVAQPFCSGFHVYSDPCELVSEVAVALPLSCDVIIRRTGSLLYEEPDRRLPIL